jgi:hypothetical protein
MKKQILDRFCRTLVNLTNNVDFSFDRLFAYYMSLVPSSQQKDAVDNYPVSQPKAWVNPSGLDVDGAKNNFFALYDFMKWLWIQIKTGSLASGFLNSEGSKLDPSVNETFFSLSAIIETFQQRILLFQDMLRGDRENKKPSKYGEPVSTNQTGISRILRNDLVRKVKNKESYNTQEWLHPGMEQCKVPYLGGYGRYIRQEKEKAEPGYYADIQCGISGSTQFMTFMYLMAMSLDASNLDEDIVSKNSKLQIISAFMILCGDGGHNGREVVFGITASYIVLNSFLSRVRDEIGHLPYIVSRFPNLGSNGSRLNDSGQPLTLTQAYNYINSMTADGNINVNDLVISLNISAANLGRTESTFLRASSIYLSHVRKQAEKDGVLGAVNDGRCILNLLRICTTWEVLVSDMYQYTSDINITGVVQEDFNAAPTPADKKDIDQWMLDKLLSTDEQIAAQGGISRVIHGKTQLPDGRTVYNQENHYTLVQVYYALDNSRFNLNYKDNFVKQGDITLSDAVETSIPNGEDITQQLESYLQQDFVRCDNLKQQGRIAKSFSYPDKGVPLAFK